MARIKRGLYEQIVDEALHQELCDGLEVGLIAHRTPLRNAEAGDRIALHIAQLVEQAVDGLSESTRVERGLRMARALIKVLANEVDDAILLGCSPVLEDTVLHAIVGHRIDGTQETLEPPLIPLLDTTLLTNAPGEPRVGHQLQTEIATADRVDIVMAFIRRSGIRPFVKAMERHCNAGRSLRVLTTVYTDSTEQSALEQLQHLGADVRVSYDTSMTRLHAKAWLFHRDAGLSTVYVGSSNLTHSAQQAGLEWNVRVSKARNPGVVQKVEAVFDTYWEGGDFLPFKAEEFAANTQRDTASLQTHLSPIEIRLEPFQERLLEQIDVAREHGRHRNLLVSATGTGKTVMAAVDYARLRTLPGRSRLLFVAHRREILTQALQTYRHAIRDGDFGELWVGNDTPKEWDHVFASIQMLSRANMEHLAPDHFDIIVVDEFHHAAAKSYSTLLEHARPVELLGLTATPERADGLPILDWFDGRIAAELRLWDAIDQHRLVPFEYFGVHDGMDLTEVPWKRGRGYDADALTNVYTANDVWARLVLDQLAQRVDDIQRMRGLGFCVTVEHARFMARVFSELGVAATAVWGDSPTEERQAALRQLAKGEIQVLFSVDLFNEGVDLPTVDTLLMLRPTESPTLFLQQLGRGLRRATGKTHCLVLDFVALHNREFRFDRRFQALLGGSRKHVERQVAQGFPFLPAGCHLELEPKAQEIVLESIRRAIPSRWAAKAAELRALASEGTVGLQEYLEQTGLALDDVYSNSRGWSDLQEAAGLETSPQGPSELQLRRACGRLLHVDDTERLSTYREMLGRDTPPKLSDSTPRETRLAHMLVASVCDQVLGKTDSLGDGLDLLWRHPQVRAELAELFEVLSQTISHKQHVLSHRPNVPLRVHARYSRIEIMAALGTRDSAKIPAWQTGVYWAEAERSDLLAFTLDKTGGQFSPTTRYKDYAISRSLIHWESQGVVREASDTGQRYQQHVAQGSGVLLFARRNTTERAFWFLGPASYVSHKGETPMAIVWRLEHALPGDLFAEFAAAVA